MCCSAGVAAILDKFCALVLFVLVCRLVQQRRFRLALVLLTAAFCYVGTMVLDANRQQEQHDGTGF